MAENGLLLARASFCERLDALARTMPSRPDRRMGEAVARLRKDALDHGLVPLAQVGQALELALARGAQGQVVRTYLHAMRDAAECTRADAAATEAYLASVRIRLGR